MTTAHVAFSIRAAARERPDAVAITCGEEILTYAEAASRAENAMGWLAERVDLRDRAARVAVVANNTVDTIVLLYALLELGVATVFIHPRASASEREWLVGDAAPRYVVEDAREAVAHTGGAPPQAPTPSDTDIAAIMYTSGTSGRPKGALLSRGALFASAAASARRLGFGPGDRWLLSIPVAHVGGLSLVLRCLSVRATVVMAPAVGSGRSFDAELACAVIDRERVTFASLIPTTLKWMLEAPRGWKPPPHLRVALVGGAGAAPDLLREAAARGVPALTTYGMTETCSLVTVQRPGTTPDASHGAGEPLDGVELRIVDEQIHVRCPMSMSGYHGRASPFVDGGWFPTGDLGSLDDLGRLHIGGRRSDLIITGGENVYPAEVELALLEAPGVAAASVFGVPDDTWGAIVAAAIVPAPAATIDDEALALFLEGRLAKHKRPRRIVVVDELPLEASGKVSRARVARELSSKVRELRRDRR